MQIVIQKTSYRSRILILLAIILMQACATNPVTGEQDFVMMSEQQEVALGKSYHQELLKEYTIYQEPGLQAYVDRIGQELAAFKLDFHFIGFSRSKRFCNARRICIYHSRNYGVHAR